MTPYKINNHALKMHGFESGLKVPLQAKSKPLQPSSSRMRGSRTHGNLWIPAFAGMTKYEVHLKDLD